MIELFREQKNNYGGSIMNEFDYGDFEAGQVICPLLSIGKDRQIRCLERNCALHMSWKNRDMYGCTLYLAVEQGARLEDALNRIGGGTDFIPDLAG